MGQKATGLGCPLCGCCHSEVSHVTHKEFTFRGVTVNKTRRRRVCRHCKNTYYTSETVEPDEIPATSPDTHVPADSRAKNPYL
jgi:transcriptional regulator NrdR family protein